MTSQSAPQPPSHCISSICTVARSDGSVGVEHDAEDSALGTAGEVLSELGLDEAGVTVAGHNLAPHGLVVGTSLLVLSFVDVGDALSVVEQ